MRSLQDLDVNFEHRIRFIFGTDEETLWRCIDRYVLYEELPHAAFTPDSCFSMINAEKMLVQINLECEGEFDLELNCGETYNSVPHRARFQGDRCQQLAAALDELGFRYQKQDDGIVVCLCQCVRSQREQCNRAIV